MNHAQFVLASCLVVALVVGGAITAARSPYLRALPRRDLLLLAGCLVLALVVRLVATTFVARFQLESAQGWVIGPAHRWAAGWSAILHFLFLFTQGTVATVARLNVLLSLVTILALFVFVDVYFEDRVAAFAAAVVLALQPIAVRYANSDSSGVLQALCLVVGAGFLASWNRRGGRWLLLQGVGWLALAANVRYESVIYAMAGLLVVIGGGGWPRAGRTRDLLLAGLLFAVCLAYPVARALRDASGGVFEMSPMGYAGTFVLSRHSPRLVVAVAFLGLAAAVVARFRAAVCFLLALVVVSLPGYFVDLECADLNNRYALPHIAFWAAFAGLGCSAAWRLGGRLLRRVRGRGADAAAAPPARVPLAVAGGVALLIAAAGLPHVAFLSRMWTHALEYDFIRAHLGSIPDACLMVGPDSGRQARGLRITEHLSREAGRRHRWLRADSPEVLAGKIEPCTVYYRATACFGYESVMAPDNPDWTGPERPECRRIGELYELEPIATTAIPSRSYQCERHTVDPVPAGFYRMRPRGPRGGGEGPR